MRLSWVKIMLAVFGFCGDAITVYHSARHLCVLQCCSAAGWSDNHGVKMEHLANFIRPRSPLATMNTPAGLRKPQHVIIIILRYWWINPHHSPPCTSLVSGQFQRTYSGSVIALKIGTLRGSWMGRVSAPSLHCRPCLGQRISKSSIIFFLPFFGMLLVLLSRI